MLTVHLTIRQLPPNADTPEGYNHAREMPTREISCTGETYEQALAECRAQAPDGWQSLGIMVDRD